MPLADLNHDGRPDFIALQSQEHERIVAFLNARRGRFKPVPLYAAPHPRWGSTGIKLADLDGDGDIDVLFNHGDAVQEPPVLRPYHGFGWLENEGNLHFSYRRLAYLPGTHTSQPGDLDGDGDLDIVSSVFIPPSTRMGLAHGSWRRWFGCPSRHHGSSSGMCWRAATPGIRVSIWGTSMAMGIPTLSWAISSCLLASTRGTLPA